MAFSVLHAAQSAGAANANSVTITAATAGNICVTFFSQTGTNTPTVTSPNTGMVISATKGVYNSSGDSVWVAYGTFAGGETAVTWGVGAGGTAHGVAAFEIAGGPASVTLDGSVVHTDNLSAATGSLTVATSVANSIILLGVGANASTGTISPWTGTNVATNISTAAARTYGGSFITTSTVNSAFTANWTTSHVAGMIAVAIQASSAVNATVTQVAATVTASGGTQTVATSNIVAIAQSAASITASGGTQVVAGHVNTSVTQIAASITASGGTQTIATVNNASITQSAGSVTATGGTQVVQTNAVISQTAATITATGGTQVIDTVNIVAIDQVAASITASGGTQTLTAQIDAAISQLAASVTATGGTQDITAESGAASVSITQAAASITATGSVQIISTSTGPITLPKLYFDSDANAYYVIDQAAALVEPV